MFLLGKRVRGGSIVNHPILRSFVVKDDAEKLTLLDEIRRGVSGSEDLFTRSNLKLGVYIASLYCRGANARYADDLVSSAVKAIPEVLKRVKDRDLCLDECMKVLVSKMHSNCSRFLAENSGPIASPSTLVRNRHRGMHIIPRIFSVDPMILRDVVLDYSESETDKAMARLYKSASTTRERFVLQKMLEGYRSVDIAELCGVSKATISLALKAIAARYKELEREENEAS